jgi:vacuolar protein sorting-associated protein 13A/C
VPDLKITLINDSTGAYGPLLSAEMELQTGRQISSADGCKLIIEILGKMDYYNPYNDSWEPLIEPFDAALQHTIRESEFPREQTTVTAGALNPIFINLSEALGLHLHKVTKMWKSLGNEPSSQDFSEQISPFSIENEFGQAIVVETQHGDAQVIESGVTVPYEREIETDRVFSVPSDGLNIRLIHDGFEIAALAGINLKKSQCVARDFAYRGETFSVLLESKLIDTRKVLTVRAPVLIKNEMNVDMHIYFPYKPRKIVSECKAGRSCPVPFLYENVAIGLLPLTMSDGQPVKVNLNDLLSKKHETWTELSINSFFFVIQVYRHSENKHKTTLRILPPLRIKNLLPCPLSACLINYRSKLQTPWCRVEKGEDWTLHDFSIMDDIGLGLKVKDSQQTKPVLIATRNLSDRGKSITVVDSERNELELMIGYSGRSSRQISIYACITLVNYTKLPLNFFTKRRGRLHKVPPQNPLEPILCSPCKKIVAELNDQKSNLIRSDAAGAHSYLNIKTVASRNTMALFQFTYTVDIAWPRPEKYFFTRNVTISPRIILVNQYTSCLAIAQMNDTSAVMILRPKERNIFYWPNADSPQYLQVRPLLDSKDEAKKALRNETTTWDWSGEFGVDRLGTIVCQCWDRLGDFAVIAAEIRLEDYASVVAFHGNDGKFNFYSVENKSKRVSLGVYQQNCIDHRRFIEPQSSLPIGWTRPRQPHNLNLELYFGSFAEIPVFLARYQFSMDKLSQYTEQKLRLSDELGLIIYIKVHSVGTSVVLEVGDGSTFRSQSDSEDEKSESQFHLLIPALGLSLIESQPPNVKELIYVHLQNVECMVETTASLRTTEVKISGAQIDNQYNAIPICPVLLFQQPESDPPLDIFKLLTMTYRDGNPTVRSFKEISVQLQTINLRVESILVQRLVALYLRANNQMKLWSDISEIDLFFRKNGPDRLTNPHWMTKELAVSHRRLYIETMHLLPIKVIFSFISLKDEHEDPEDNEVLAILQSRKMIMLSIDSATVKFPSCDLSQVYMSQQRLKKVVSMHYQERLRQEVFRLIWHTDILGTPMNFLSHIGTAVFDLVNEPVQGIVNGPIEGGKGLIKGAGSFVKNSVSATFGSVSKLTGSVATGITALTQGRDGLIERQKDKAKDRPKDALEGVFFGVKSIVMGIGRGVTGVVTEPVKGAKKKGFLGFLAGGARGIVGIVGKPVAGVFDAVSKTAEGINNTAHSSEMKLGSLRIRPPRVTYGSAHRIRKYRLIDAEMWEDLIGLDEEYGKLSFCYYSTGVNIEGKEVAILVFYEKIVVRLVDNKGVFWESDMEDIASVEILQVRLGVGIRRKPGRRGEQRPSFTFTTISQNSQRKFVEKVDLVLRESSQDH